MTDEEKTLLGILEARIRHLMFTNKKLEEKNSSLEQLLKEKEEQLSKLEADYNDLQRAYSDRKAAIVASLNSADIGETRQKLSRLVREVDRCIALLKNNN